MIEFDAPKLERQPLVQDATFVEPATDDSAGTPAEGFVMTVFCDAPPSDGDTAVYVAANNRFELRAGASGGSPVTIDDGMGGFDLTYTAGGDVVYA
jgi:hypothetical protein